MHGQARLPTWLYPITGHTIGILAIIGVGIVKVVHEFVVHWREDRRDDSRTVGERHVDVCRQLGCEYDLPTVPCDGCEDRYRDDEEL